MTATRAQVSQVAVLALLVAAGTARDQPPGGQARPFTCRTRSTDSMAGKEINYIHAQTIYADQIDKETVQDPEERTRLLCSLLPCLLTS